jgi:hypothetical protein
MLVKLTYFKRNGKYYSSGEYQTTQTQLFEIWQEVHDMTEHPGLLCKWTEGPISIDVPRHRNRHPHLIIYRKNDVNKEQERIERQLKRNRTLKSFNTKYETVSFTDHYKV